jgi:hypothetical protein
LIGRHWYIVARDTIASTLLRIVVRATPSKLDTIVNKLSLGQAYFEKGWRYIGQSQVVVVANLERTGVEVRITNFELGVVAKTACSKAIVMRIASRTKLRRGSCQSTSQNLVLESLAFRSTAVRLPDRFLHQFGIRFWVQASGICGYLARKLMIVRLFGTSRRRG